MSTHDLPVAKVDENCDIETDQNEKVEIDPKPRLPQGDAASGPKIEYRKFGLNNKPVDQSDIHEVANFNLIIRICLFVTLLISWSCEASYLAKIGSAKTFGFNECVQGACSGPRWLLSVGIISWLYVGGIFALCFLVINKKPELSAAFTKASLIGDLIFVFLTISAFSSGATFSISANSGLASSAAAFMFFAWVLFAYSTVQSVIMYSNNGLFNPIHDSGDEPNMARV